MKTTCCVECGARSHDPLYNKYGGRNIRLSLCQVCDSPMDKYLEFDPVLVTIDLILHKIEVYRHLLFNSSVFLPRARAILSNMSLVFVIMVCFDAYIKWHTSVDGGGTTNNCAPPICSIDAPYTGVGPVGVGTGVPMGGEAGLSGVDAVGTNLLNNPAQFLNPSATVPTLLTTTHHPNHLYKGRCFNTSMEGVIIERFVDGIRDIEFWIRCISLFSLALIENVIYITGIVLSIRLWESICPLNSKTNDDAANPINKATPGTTGTTAAQQQQPHGTLASTDLDGTAHHTGPTTTTAATARSINAPLPFTVKDTTVNTATAATATTASPPRTPTPPSPSPTPTTRATGTQHTTRPRTESLDGLDVSVSTTMIVCAVVLSSWGKALLLLLMVWEYSNDMIHIINFVVVASNFTAVHSLLSIGRWPPRAVSLVLVLLPYCLRTLFQMAISHTLGWSVVYSTAYTPW